MTRFDMDMDGSMEPSEHGQWVLYEDVQLQQEQRSDSEQLGEPIRGLVKELMRQIEIGDFVDGHGHSAKMLDAVHKLNKELQND